MSDGPFRVLTSSETAILSLLSSSSTAQYGLDLVRRSDGRLKRGTVYVALQRLEDDGCIASRREASADERIGISRRVYCTTEHGHRQLVGQQMGNPALILG